MALLPRALTSLISASSPPLWEYSLSFFTTQESSIWRTAPATLEPAARALLRARAAWPPAGLGTPEHNKRRGEFKQCKKIVFKKRVRLCTLQCASHCEVRLCSVHGTGESDSAVCMALGSQTLQCAWHWGVRLCSVHDTVESNSSLYMTLTLLSLSIRLDGCTNFLKARHDRLYSSFNPNKQGIGEKSPTFIQNDFTP